MGHRTRSPALVSLVEAGPIIARVIDQDAHEMVRSIRGAPLLVGHRGSPSCDVSAVEDVLLRAARLAEEVPRSPRWTSTR
jgi:acyl-CoA synthetase (NDP forming)